MSCTVCQHPNRLDIDQALAAGSATLKALGDKYGLSTSALHRHQAHLRAKMNQAREGLQNSLLQTCVFWLHQALDMAMQTAKAAQAEGNGKLVLQALSQGTRIIKIMLKQDVQFDDRLIYEILSSPQWTAEGSLLPDDPGLLALSRQNLATILSSPCSDTPPEASTSVSPGDLALMPQFLHNPDYESACLTSTENRKPHTYNHFCKRDKSGKKSGNSPSQGSDSVEIQLDELEKMISQLERDAQAPAAPNNQFSAIMDQLNRGGGIPKDKPLSEYIYEQSLKGNPSTKI